MMGLLEALFGKRAKNKSEPRMGPMRCMTPFIQANEENPHFFIDFKKVRSDGSMHVERLYPSSGKTEIFTVSPDGSIENADAGI